MIYTLGKEGSHASDKIVNCKETQRRVDDCHPIWRSSRLLQVLPSFLMRITRCLGINLCTRMDRNSRAMKDVLISEAERSYAQRLW